MDLDAQPDANQTLAWVALPGLLSAPSDFDQVAGQLDIEVRRLDQRETPLAAPFEQLDEALGLSSGEGQLGLVGHSLGASTAINLALDLQIRQPGRVAALVLLDPDVPAKGPLPQFLANDRLDVLAARLVTTPSLWPLQTRLAKTVGRTFMRIDLAERRREADKTAIANHRAFADGFLGTPEGLHRLWDNLRTAWVYDQALAQRLEDLDQPLAATLGFKPYSVVGMRGPRAKRQAQREFGISLGAHLIPAWGASHLLTLSRPELVANVMTSAAQPPGQADASGKLLEELEDVAAATAADAKESVPFNRDDFAKA
ncbi:MAG: lipase family protein [Micrococcales bacterium]|nr:lipase family protein [Micrococcales bacterium]